MDLDDDFKLDDDIIELEPNQQNICSGSSSIKLPSSFKIVVAFLRDIKIIKVFKGKIIIDLLIVIEL